MTLAFVQLGYARALATLSPVFDELLDELGKTALTRNVLIALAKGKRIYSGLSNNPNEIKRAIDTLISKGVIEKSARGTYYFVEPMLKDYLVQTIETY